MAHVLRLTNGTTINLNDQANTFLLEYVPQSPDLSVVDFTPQSLRDGGERTSITRRNITESVSLLVAGSTMDGVRAVVRNIENALRMAEEYQMRKVGARWFVEFDPGNTGTVYRSEILSGKVAWDEDTLTKAWNNKKVHVTIAWTRRFYWEGPEVELPLRNGTVVQKQTGGVTVYNHDDGDAGHDNWVEIDGADVGGVIPAPIRIGMLNSYNVTARTQFFYLGLNAFSNPASFSQVLEAENRNYVAGSAAPTTNTGCSNGQFQTITWTGDSDVYLISWQLSPTLLQNCAGNQFRVLARFSSSPTGSVKLRVRLTAPSGYRLSVLAEGAEVSLGNSILIQDLGVVKIHPGTYQGSGLEAIDLCLYGRKTGGGTLGLDFVQLTPVDGFRKLWPRGYNAIYNSRTVDDGIEGRVWNEMADGSDKSGQFIGFGVPLHIWPAKTQRVYLLTTNDTGGAEIARTHIIQVWYRPRRLTL